MFYAVGSLWWLCTTTAYCVHFFHLLSKICAIGTLLLFYNKKSFLSMKKLLTIRG